jgi:hypothetical protein
LVTNIWHLNGSNALHAAGKMDWQYRIHKHHAPTNQLHMILAGWGNHKSKINSSTQAARHAVTPFPCVQGCSLTQGCARKQGWPDAL